ncbi:hypothetical protein MferCBS31731_003062 [Microsporum ferrugineum]
MFTVLAHDRPTETSGPREGSRVAVDPDAIGTEIQVLRTTPGIHLDNSAMGRDFGFQNHFKAQYSLALGTIKMTSYTSASQAYERERIPTHSAPYSTTPPSGWSDKYRGATVEDLDPPPALSTSPHALISTALLSAYERDYTHLTVISSDSRSLLGYLSIPRLKSLLKAGTVSESDPVEKAMLKFRRKGRVYQVITMDTPLEDLEMFFDGRLYPSSGMGENRQKQDFAVVTDASRKFVLGVATREDLEQFVKRRPA